MRRIKGTYILIPLFCTLLCTLLCIGCDNEDTTLMPTQPIGFSTSVDDSDTHADTRAEATTANLTEIGVHAYFTGTSDYAPNAFTPNFLYNQSVKKVNGTWTYDPVKYWPANPNDKVSFFAYAPHSATTTGNTKDKITVFPSTSKKNLLIGYSEPSGELDLLLSLGELNRTNNQGPVQFTMKHAMAKVIFKVKVEGGASKTITGVSTQSGKFVQFTVNDSNTEIQASAMTNNKVTCEATNLNITAGSTATTVKEFFLPPQHMGDTQVSLTYLDGSTPKTIEATLPNPIDNDWTPGKAIGYTFTIKDNQIISIAVDADMAWDAQEKPKPKYEGYDYVIATFSDLLKFSSDVKNGNTTSATKAIQIADIDLSSYTDWIPIGPTSSTPFQGEYHGNGYAIKNLTVRGSYIGKDSDVAGFFGYTRGAFLTGIHLQNANVTITGTYNSYSPRCVGTLLGEADGQTQITSCSATGKIGTVACRYDDTKISATGGLIGSGATSFISFCYANVNIGEDGIYTPTLHSGGHYSFVVGGFIGNMLTTSYPPGCNIAACRSLGNITLKNINPVYTHTINVGGFIGSDTPSGTSNIGGSYSTGNITISFDNYFPNGDGSSRTLNAGGFIGVANSIKYFLSCYSHTSIALTYEAAKNSNVSIGDFYLAGFAGNVGSNCRPQNCYGKGLEIPSSTVFPKIHSNEFSPNANTFIDCYSNSSLISAGKTVQDIMVPGTRINLPYQFRIIEYDPSTNSYITNSGKQTGWDSERGWKKAPFDTANPEINYDILNITP